MVYCSIGITSIQGYANHYDTLLLDSKDFSLISFINPLPFGPECHHVYNNLNISPVSTSQNYYFTNPLTQFHIEESGMKH